MSTDPCNRTTLNLVVFRDLVTGECLVDRVELQDGSLRHCISPTMRKPSFDRVFSAPFAEFIQDKILQLSSPYEVFSELEAEFSSVDLSLSQMHILANKRTGDTQKIVIRFMRVVGVIQAILKDVHTATRTEPNQIAVEALERVVGRAFDIARACETIPGFRENSTPFKDCTDDILTKRRELLFRLGLLQKAVVSQRNTKSYDDANPARLKVVS